MAGATRLKYSTNSRPSDKAAVLVVHQSFGRPWTFFTSRSGQINCSMLWSDWFKVFNIPVPVYSVLKYLSALSICACDIIEEWDLPGHI